MSENIKNKVYNMYDNDVVKWEHDGKLYALHVRRDCDPYESPRDWETISTMACFHPRYNLGDPIGTTDSEEFWRKLVRDTVPEDEIVKAAEDGKLTGIRIAPNEEDPHLIDIYETVLYRTVLGNSGNNEELFYAGETREHAVYDLLDDLTIPHCMVLMEPYAEWMPLWLYDHGGISMSCGSRTYPYSDRWDSGCVGWIIAMKDNVMSNVADYVLDENGQRIPVEGCKGAYQLKPVTEDTWRSRAVEVMTNEVTEYDQYLTGDVYGFTLYEEEATEDDGDPDWVEVSSCWGFYGSDILENGIEEDVGSGLRKAIESGSAVSGTATRHTVAYYTFDF